MYKNIINEFKKKLTDRQLDTYFNNIFIIITMVSLITETILFIFYKFWLIPILCSVFSIIIAFISAHIVIFVAINKNTKLKAKDYFNYKKLSSILSSIQPKDIEILIEILKASEINTRPKVQEAIRHFQNLLLRKSNNGISTITILSIAISMLGIMVSGFVIASAQDIILFLIVLISFTIMIVLICAFAKMIYKTAYYSTSEYALYERIENALSEIWIRQLIK